MPEEIAPATTEDENVGRTIVSGGVWRLVAFGFASLLGVVATAIISRELGPADFALFTTAVSLIAVATLLPDLGLVTLGLREFASLEGEERARGQRALITLRLIFSALGALGIVLFAIFDNYPSDLVIGLAVAGVGLCALSLYVSWAVPIQATYRLGTMAILEASRQFLVAGLMILAVLLYDDVGVVVAIYLPAGILLAVVSAVLARGVAPLRPSLDWTTMRGLMHKVGTFAIAASVGGIYAYVAQILSNSILTPHDSGMFGLVFRVYAVMIGAAVTAVSGAFPLLVTSWRTDAKRLTYATRRLVQTTFISGIAGAVTLICGAEFVVAVIGGPEFDDAIGVMRVVALALPASFVLITGGSYLLAAEHHRTLVKISVGGALVSIGITAALSAAFGLYGTAAGLVIGEFVISSGYVGKIWREDRSALPSLGWTGAVVALGALCCLPALLPLPSVVLAAIGLLAFAGLSIIFKLVPPELTDRIPGLK
jgi:O-antigen/teichoic acid export membrane protein